MSFGEILALGPKAVVLYLIGFAAGATLFLFVGTWVVRATERWPRWLRWGLVGLGWLVSLGVLLTR